MINMEIVKDMSKKKQPTRVFNLIISVLTTQSRPMGASTAVSNRPCFPAHPPVNAYVF